MTGKNLSAVALAAAGLLVLGCRQDMHDQPRIDPLEAHTFFADGMGSRRLPAGTVARGMVLDNPHLLAGKDSSGEFVDELPPEIALDRQLLVRGHDRYEIYCSPCHDSTGGGRGMIVRRGLRQPAPYWEERLLDMPIGYFFDVMTEGYGIMSSYAHQVPVEDRWAIAAYVRVLQTRQTLRLEDLSSEAQAEFREALSRQDLAHQDAEPHAEEEHH